MKNYFKLKKIILTMIMCFIFLFFGGLKVQGVSSETQRVEVYKLSLEVGDPGISQTDPGSLLKKYPGLNGVTYGVFDVTSAYYSLRKEGFSKEQAQADLAVKDPVDNKPLAEATTTTVSSQDGVAVFDLPCQDSLGRAAVYLFKEIGGIVSGGTSTNLVLVLPVADSTTIKLFPKQQSVREEPPFVKEVDHYEGSYEEPFVYHLKTRIPTSVWTYKNVEIEDKAVSELILNEASITVKVNGEMLDEQIYDLITHEQGFLLRFDPLALQPYAGGQLSISYQMHIKTGSAAEKKLVNKSSLQLNDKKITAEAWVKTGGARFRKVDHLDFSKGLVNASFAISNQAQEYLTRNGWQALNKTQLVEDNAELFVVTSNEMGYFQTLGLGYGEYYLHELTAPKDYVLSQSPVKFIVDERSYVDQNKAASILKVVNIKKNTQITPFNKRKKTLPKTGEFINNYYILGCFILLITYYLLKKYVLKPLKENE